LIIWIKSSLSGTVGLAVRAQIALILRHFSSGFDTGAGSIGSVGVVDRNCGIADVQHRTGRERE
jgi:hypothetical protein